MTFSDHLNMYNINVYNIYMIINMQKMLVLVLF